jgi:hypothetical protein
LITAFSNATKRPFTIAIDFANLLTSFKKTVFEFRFTKTKNAAKKRGTKEQQQQVNGAAMPPVHLGKHDTEIRRSH